MTIMCKIYEIDYQLELFRLIHIIFGYLGIDSWMLMVSAVLVLMIAIPLVMCTCFVY